MANKDFDFWKKNILDAQSKNSDRIIAYNKLKELHIETDCRENFLFEICQTFQSNIFLKTPIPYISPSIKQYGKDADISIAVSSIIEPTLVSSYRDNNSDEEFFSSFEHLLLSGKAIIWQSYKFDGMNEDTSKSKGFLGLFKKAPVLPVAKFNERICIESISPEDYLESPVKRKKDKWWVARRGFLDEDGVKKEFGKSVSDNKSIYTAGDGSDKTKKFAEYWEIWNKDKQERIYIIVQDPMREAIKTDSNPYQIGNKFPCECAEFWNGKSIWDIIKNPLERIEKLNNEIELLEAIIKYKVVGPSSSQDDISKIISATNGDFVGLDIPKGQKVSDAFEVMPTAPIVEMIAHKKLQIDWYKDKAYGLLGLSDITRGQTNPDETAAAQGLKAQFGNLRFNYYQLIFEKFIERCFEKTTKIITGSYSFSTLQEIAGTKYPSIEEITAQAPGSDISKIITIEELQEAMKNNSLDYSVDSSAFISESNYQKEIYDAMSSTIAGIIQNGSQAIQITPELGDSIVAMARILVSNGRISKSVSSTFIKGIEKALDEFKAQATQPKEQVPAPQPTPDAVMKANTQIKTAEIKAKQQAEKDMIDRDIAMKKLELDELEILLKRQELQAEQEANRIRVAQGIAPDTNLG